MRLRSFLRVAAGVVVLVPVLVYSHWLLALVRQGPLLQIACVDVEPPAVAWHCEQVLRHVPLSAGQVRELNLVAGISAPLSLKNAALARQLAADFIRQGVDVNATDLQGHGFSALHGAVMAKDRAMVETLLALGARAQVQDDQGRSVIELARMLRQRHPDDVVRAELLERLESASAARP